jgi:hypothetical protein
MSYRFVDSLRAGPGWNILVDKDRTSCSCSKAACTVPVWRILLLSVQWINSWWWTEALSEICRVSYQNKFVKLVHLVGFIVKIFIVGSAVGIETFVGIYRINWRYEDRVKIARDQSWAFVSTVTTSRPSWPDDVSSCYQCLLCISCCVNYYS